MSEAPARPPIDPRAEAERLRTLDGARFSPYDDAARRRLLARILDAVRARFTPLPRSEMLVGLVLALPDAALAHAALMLELASPASPLGIGLSLCWTRAASDAGEVFGIDAESRGAAAFEGALGGIARALAGKLTVAEALSETSRGEWVVRLLAHATSTPTQSGKRLESEERRTQALARLDPGAARDTAHRLSREERTARTIAALDKELASGGTIPDAAKYGAL